MQGNALRHSLPSRRYSAVQSPGFIQSLVQRCPSPASNMPGDGTDACDTDRLRPVLRKGPHSSVSSFRARSYSRGHSPLNKTLPVLKDSGDSLPPLPSQPQPPQKITNNGFEAAIDAFLQIDKPLPLALESFFAEFLNASTVCYWEDIPSLQILFSRTNGIKCQRDTGIAGAAFITHEKSKASMASLHPTFDQVDAQIAPKESPVICFPLWDHTSAICGVVEVFRTPGAEEFSSRDEEFIDYFTKKFKILSRFLISEPHVDPIMEDVLRLMTLDQLFSSFENRVNKSFNCRRCEVWHYEKTENKTTCLTHEKTIVEGCHAGIVGESMRNMQMVNCPLNKLHCSYDPACDGTDEEPVLVFPITYHSSDDKYAVVLRGPIGRPLFTGDDEKRLKVVGPFLVLSTTNAVHHSECFEKSQRQKFKDQGLEVLYDVAQAISSPLDINTVTSMIVEKARQLVDGDRCAIFLVNEKEGKLVSSFAKGVTNPIEIPFDRGIVGKSMTENRTFMVSQAYDDPAFDKSVDAITGYKTRSVLSVPIRKGERVIGVTEILNKKGGKEFTEWDARLVGIFNTFCGMALENDKLHKDGADMAIQLRSFFEVSLSLSKAENLRNLLAEIMQNARIVVGAERASLFLLDPAAQVLKSLIFDGSDAPPTLPLNIGIAAFSATKKESIIVNDVYHDPRFNRSVDQQTEFKTRSVCVAPVVNSDGTVLGVVQMVNKKNGDFLESDLNLLQCFAGFAAVAMENNKLKDIATLGTVEVELDKWIGKSEQDKCDEIPTLLRLTEEQTVKMKQLNFFAIDWNEVDKIKILFSLFNEFNLMTEFKIPNEMLFRFLYEIRKTYHAVPYHNWIHAVDVSQYVSYEMRTGNLVSEFTKFEILSMLVSAICHDAGHDGFNNIYNVKAETPLGILFKDQSVMETHHCSVAIDILSRDECNLFHTLSDDQSKKMWTTIITLILATDMAHHFKLVKSATEYLESGSFNVRNIEHRILLMQLILKVGDISNVSRPFTIADKWCDVLSQEFFRQGDHELRQGIGLTSPLNDREHPDKPKSQIGFYNFICIPLYQAVSRMVPELVVNLNSVKANLEVWKSMMPPPEPKPEEETK